MFIISVFSIFFSCCFIVTRKHNQTRSDKQSAKTYDHLISVKFYDQPHQLASSDDIFSIN